MCDRWRGLKQSVDFYVLAEEVDPSDGKWLIVKDLKGGGCDVL